MKIALQAAWQRHTKHGPIRAEQCDWHWWAGALEDSDDAEDFGPDEFRLFAALALEDFEAAHPAPAAKHKIKVRPDGGTTVEVEDDDEPEEEEERAASLAGSRRGVSAEFSAAIAKLADALTPAAPPPPPTGADLSDRMPWLVKMYPNAQSPAMPLKFLPPAGLVEDDARAFDLSTQTYLPARSFVK